MTYTANLKRFRACLAHLGYDGDGAHPDERSLVFVGDFCDRGPDSPAVLALVQALVESKRAVAVLGNHEVNLLREDAKEGAGWFFHSRREKDHEFEPYKKVSDEARVRIVAFLASLPVGLEREDLRVIHAAWQAKQIALVREVPAGTFRESYEKWERAARRHAIETEVEKRAAIQLAKWGHDLHDPQKVPPFMPAVAERDVNMQMMNPLKVLTSGVERAAKAPFFAGGKWRFTERVQWWDEYGDAIPAVIGHYWRRVNRANPEKAGKRGRDMFDNLKPTDWHGKHNNVFCVDFSVGARYEERKAKPTGGCYFKLAALRWPELTLMFDDEEGHEHAVTTHGPDSF